MTHPNREPAGVILADQEADVLRTDRVFRIIEDGRWRELRLRVARGTIRDVETRASDVGRET